MARPGPGPVPCAAGGVKRGEHAKGTEMEMGDKQSGCDRGEVCHMNVEKTRQGEHRAVVKEGEQALMNTRKP
jgi:hypothetical protein